MSTAGMTDPVQGLTAWHPVLIPGRSAEDLIPHLDEGTGLCLCDCSACSVRPEDVDGICICPDCTGTDDSCAHEPAALR